jgi:2',3'-cyclic-nucleotide 2'-phosphodiesterase (5'-nucleotidase family)
MANLKKYTPFKSLFVLFLTLTICGCASAPYRVSKKEGKTIPVTDAAGSANRIEGYIEPFRTSLNKDLSTVLAYAPQTLDKSKGKWQTSIGNLMADVSRQRGNLIFKARKQKDIDVCLLNQGGIRSIIPQGDVTTRTAFEIMPFENSLVVAELKAEQIREIAAYIIADKKPHPLSGMTFTINNGSACNIKIKGEDLNDQRTYFVATSDYLLNGGDKMDFFGKAVNVYDLDYKIRNVLIDYFKEVDTINAADDIRIIENIN